MVSLDSLSRDAAPSRSGSVLTSKQGMRHRFSLGGVALEILPEPGFAWTLPAETEQHTRSTTTTGAPKLGAVTCSVRVDKSLTQMQAASAVAWEKTSDGICVRARQVVLDIAALGPRRYVVSARIASPSLLTLMLNTLVTSVAELAGGLCLHATAVAVAEGAVLLLGPSGAGKTTAAELLGGDVACLSNDRVTLVPDPIAAGKYWVWSLPVGKAPELERCREVSLPLVALLRVQQASERESSVAPVREVQALMQIRQAIDVSAGSEFFEPQRLTAVGALASAAKSGVAQVALSAGWRAQLLSFLAAVPEVPERLTGGSSGASQPQKSALAVDGTGP
jgi:hypothetical protein